MFLSMLKNIKRFYRQPKPAQWFAAIILSSVCALFIFYLIDSIYLPLLILVIPVAKPIGHFLVVPLLRLSGILKYYSPMLIGIRPNSDVLEIHNGSSFDYLINMRWKQRGQKAKKKMMTYYLRGFLKIIDEIEKKKLPENVTLTGTSYFFSDKSVKKIGFSEIKVGLVRKLLFFLDYINLCLMYSYSNGRLTFPSVLKLKKVEISGKKLRQSKEKIISLLYLINRKHSYRISTAL